MNRLYLSGTLAHSARYVTAEGARFLKVSLLVSRTWTDPRKTTQEERTDAFELRFYGPAMTPVLDELLERLAAGAHVTVEGQLTPVRGSKRGGVFVEVTDPEAVVIAGPPPDREAIIRRAMTYLVYDPQDGDPDIEDLTLLALSEAKEKPKETG